VLLRLITPANLWRLTQTAVLLRLITPAYLWILTETVYSATQIDNTSLPMDFD
jgi:hypothetical protein